jgi:hypothetical protein
MSFVVSLDICSDGPFSTLNYTHCVQVCKVFSWLFALWLLVRICCGGAFRKRVNSVKVCPRKSSSTGSYHAKRTHWLVYSCWILCWNHYNSFVSSTVLTQDKLWPFSHDLLLEISFIFHPWTKLQSLVTWKLIGYVCRDAAFCLICGDLLCFNSKCCYRDAEECSRHADEGGVSRLIVLSVE